MFYKFFTTYLYGENRKIRNNPIKLKDCIKLGITLLLLIVKQSYKTESREVPSRSFLR